MQPIVSLSLGFLLAAGVWHGAAAQEGAVPSAGPDRTVLPMPLPPFEGVIGRTYKESTEDWPKLPTPPEGAPNVVVIMLDDVGFGQTSTFGGPVPTPELDKLAEDGLRYTRFHTTAICGPSRAALITGRNHHNAGSGFLMRMGDRLPELRQHDPARDGDDGRDPEG